MVVQHDLCRTWSENLKTDFHNTTVSVQAHFLVFFVKSILSHMYSYIGKSIFIDYLGSNTDPCYIENVLYQSINYKEVQVYIAKACEHIEFFKRP